MKVLIIEDDQKIINNISFCLEVVYDGVSVIPVSNEHKALGIVKNESTDLVIIDVCLSSIDIIALIHKMRECSDVPIIILSEAKTDMEIAMGLEAGADEHISKQFNPIELIARCRALLRRCRKSVFSTDIPVSVNGLTINFVTREVLLSGQPIKLTPIEFGLLSELTRNIGKVVPTDELLDKIWGTKYIGDPNLVKTYIYRLRSKLKPVNGKSIKILCERGVGYRLVQNT